MDVALNRVLAPLVPGGRMAFAEPNYLNPQVWPERTIPAVRRMVGTSPDETAIVRWGMRRKLLSLGFQDVVVRNFDWLHPATPGFLIPAVSALGRSWRGSRSSRNSLAQC